MNNLIRSRFADHDNTRSVAARLRRKRVQCLLGELKRLPSPVSILDVGGNFQFWKMTVGGTDLFDKIRVTLVNLDPREATHPNFTAVVADGRSMPQFHDQQFDIAFSNSTIEHVGSLEDQARFANEIRRVGRRYYVQTPNRYFPIEPHFVFPCFQFLPMSLRLWLVRHYSLGWMPRMRDREEARRELESLRLLSRKELQRIFPESQIYDERFGGFTKSFVAHTLHNPVSMSSGGRAAPQTARAISKDAPVATV